MPASTDSKLQFVVICSNLTKFVFLHGQILPLLLLVQMLFSWGPHCAPLHQLGSPLRTLTSGQASMGAKAGEAGLLFVSVQRQSLKLACCDLSHMVKSMKACFG